MEQPVSSHSLTILKSRRVRGVLSVRSSRASGQVPVGHRKDLRTPESRLSPCRLNEGEAPTPCVLAVGLRCAQTINLKPTFAAQPVGDGRWAEFRVAGSGVQSFELDAVGLLGVRAQAFVVRFVIAEIAGEPLDVTVAFESEHVRRDPVQKPAIVRNHHEPGKFSSASSSARSVSTSRSFVGSSSSSTLAPWRNSFARCKRLRSPPDRSPTFFC